MTALTTMVAVSSGCFGLPRYSIGQRDLLGDGFLAIEACVSEQGSQRCPSGGRSGTFPIPAPDTQVQALVGVQAPDTYVFPDTISQPPPFLRAWFGGTYTRSPSLTAELTRLSPPPTGSRWIGYVSEPQASFSPGQTYYGQIPFGRPPLNGAPQSDVFTNGGYTLGARQVTAEAPASRPVSCDSADGTICIDQGPMQFSQRVFHDLLLVAPQAVTAPRGTTAVIPVTAKFAGEADANYAFALTATTSLPGTSATPNVPTLTPPTNSTTGLSVSVPVPADATPGTYTVTMTATIGSTAESRAATANIVVPAPSVPAGSPPPGAGGPPAVAVTAARGLTAMAARTRGLPVRVTTDTETLATIALSQVRRIRVGRRVVSRPVQLARRTVTVPAGSSTVRVKSRLLLPGRVNIVITGSGFSARAATVLR